MAYVPMYELIEAFEDILRHKGFYEEDGDGIQTIYAKMKNEWEDERKRNSPVIVLMKKTGAWTYYYKGRVLHKGNIKHLLPF